MTAKSKFSYFVPATSEEAVRRGFYPRAVARRLESLHSVLVVLFGLMFRGCFSVFGG